MTENRRQIVNQHIQCCMSDLHSEFAEGSPDFCTLSSDILFTFQINDFHAIVAVGVLG